MQDPGEVPVTDFFGSVARTVPAVEVYPLRHAGDGYRVAV